jgi:dienelactone hydrolase
LGEKKSASGVVLLGGSGGGLNWQEVTAAALASRGYAALALAYFNVDPLPRQLERVPIDGVLAAIDEFPRLAGVDRVVVAGLSKGAELALLVASMNQTVRGVIAFAPSSTVFQSFPWVSKLPTPASSWTLYGKEIPYAPLQREQPALPGEPGDRAWLDYLILHSEAVETAAIPVERINGPVLLFSGGEDRIWPSRVMADKIVARLRERKFQHRVQHITFQDVGHAFATPGYLPTSRAALNNGGSPRATAWAQTTSWATVQRFLDALSK